MKILIFAGALREKSFNKKLCKVVVKAFSSKENEFIEVDLKALNLPVYDQDIEDEQGFPKTLVEFGEKVKIADAIVISTPEYNASISSPLKNTVDWLSRLKPMPLEKKKILLVGASLGGLGATHGLRHSRQPFDKLVNFVYPKNFGLSKAHEAFNADGSLKDLKQHETLTALVQEFLEWKI